MLFIGIDLGTSNIKIYKKGDGIVIDEKNLIAIGQDFAITVLLKICAEKKYKNE